VDPESPARTAPLETVAAHMVSVVPTLITAALAVKLLSELVMHLPPVRPSLCLQSQQVFQLVTTATAVPTILPAKAVFSETAVLNGDSVDLKTRTVVMDVNRHLAAALERFFVSCALYCFY